VTAETLGAEERARADVYALLARLFYAPPNPELIQILAGLKRTADAAESAFARGIDELARTAAAADAEGVREEFEAVFIGVGKAEVTLYASAYLTRGAHHAPLVEIRDLLAEHGLERIQQAGEPEDHVAALCDAMRHLVMQADLEAQRSFFERYLWPAMNPLCDAIIQCQRVDFYRAVAGLGRAFAELEHDAFQMD